MAKLLFSPYALGGARLANRVVMSPMTRSRALGNVPNDLMATYYAQRAEAGLIITEGASPSPDGLGYPRMPGLFADEHVAGWRRITDAVHAAGSRIFVELMHTGRVGHPQNLPPGARVLGPSAVAAPGAMYTDAAGPKPHPVPEAMSVDDIARAIGEHERAAGLAIAAGFDGVELHGANGYLIDQFLNAASNRRTDGWGGSVAGRIRFAVEVARRAAGRIGADRVGLRISPYGTANGMAPDEDHDELYAQLAESLSAMHLAYIHVADHSAVGGPLVGDEIKRTVRECFGGGYILSGGYDAERAERDLRAGRGDLVAFGRPFVANPRLVSRMRRGAALLAPDRATFYTPGARGYTDYPVEG